jgi:hypothetical protein
VLCPEKSVQPALAAGSGQRDRHLSRTDRVGVTSVALVREGTDVHAVDANLLELLDVQGRGDRRRRARIEPLRHHVEDERPSAGLADRQVERPAPAFFGLGEEAAAAASSRTDWDGYVVLEGTAHAPISPSLSLIVACWDWPAGGFETTT